MSSMAISPKDADQIKEQSPPISDRPQTSPVHFGREICGELSAAEKREWLVTNGIGGFASGTVAGVQTRRYHDFSAPCTFASASIRKFALVTTRSPSFKPDFTS